MLKAHYRRWSFSYLLVCLFAAIFIFPGLQRHPIVDKILSVWIVLVTVLMLTSIAPNQKPSKYFLWFLGAVAISFSAWNLALNTYGEPTRAFYEYYLPFAIVYFSYTTIYIIRAVLSVSEVTTDIISGAVLAYLLIGFCCGIMFTYVEMMFPGSFIYPHYESNNEYFGLFYFSFVCSFVTDTF